MAADHGLTPAQLSRIKEILAHFAVHLDWVALFGSRASGAYRPSSDIDLVLYGPIDEKNVDRLHTLFMESTLPLKVDIVSYQNLNHAPLKRHIDQTGVTLFKKEDLMAEGSEFRVVAR
jgi:predicted nucleotidyltransferase